MLVQPSALAAWHEKEKTPACVCAFVQKNPVSYFRLETKR